MSFGIMLRVRTTIIELMRCSVYNVASCQVLFDNNDRIKSKLRAADGPNRKGERKGLMPVITRKTFEIQSGKASLGTVANA